MTNLKKQPKKRKSPLGFRIGDKKLLEAALSHPSYRNECSKPSKMADFDRLEFFGDSVLNLVVVEKLYLLYPEADEGLLSRMRSTLVSRKILLKTALTLKLHEHIRVGRGLSKQLKSPQSKMLTDCFEAVIAALYFDQGYDRTKQFILKNLAPYFDAKKLFRLDPNPKSTLQELCLKQWKRLPVYTNSTDPSGTTTKIMIHQRLTSKAHGKTRKESEAKAARQLIQKVRKRMKKAQPKIDSSGRKLRRTL